MKTSTKRSRIATTTAEIAAATRAARQRELVATKIRAVRYNPESDTISVELSTEATLTVPRHAIPGFATASVGALDDLAITPGREGLWSEAVDDGVLLEQLLVVAAGATTLGTLGARLNAAKKSPARAAASRSNGRKGGRPRKAA